MAELGLYIHYPYCRRRCDYCDFAIEVPGRAGAPNSRYREAILAELHHRADAFSGRELVSIYFGGGTPSLWPAEELAAVVSAATAVWGDRSLVEVTLEANPIDCTPAALRGWQQAGINRISIGVQSTSATELAVLGRDHSMGDGMAALERVLGAGFERVSADVIIGTPGSARAGLQSLEEIAARGPDHISVYELTFEEGAPLGRAEARGEICRRSGDELADIYAQARGLLASVGYEHYEISSYAQAGAQAVHNSLYWRGGEFLGIGSSAASYRRGEEGGAWRSTNIRSASRYLAARPGNTIVHTDTISKADDRLERLWLSMRTSAGAALAELEAIGGLVEWLTAGGLAECADDRMIPTLKGFLYADQVAARIVG